MADPAATRVVLLARDGEACERLAAALKEAGAELALIADPSSIEPATVVDAQPDAVLVALEPAIEDALERFEAILSDPAITVIFDEAELAAQRTGWDAARWTRHLAAKLNRHGDVLPPGWEIETDLQPSPGPLPGARAAATGDLAAIADEAQLHAGGVPRGDLPDASFAAPDGPGLAPIADAQTPPTGATVTEEEAMPLDRPTAVFGEAEAVAFDATASGLSLAADDAVTGGAEVRGGQSFERDLDAIDERLAGLSLADEDSYGHGPLRGAVVVEGGLGGPDAVRQLLAAMPVSFARPLLVRLHLDGGRYDRLVTQMQRASTLPVTLAEPGQLAEPGTVYFLAPAVSIERSGAQLRFAMDDQPDPDLFAVLPASDSAVLVLSGTLDANVEPSASAMADGALVICQAPESCYDASASAALIERGAARAEAAELAARLTDRWPS